MGTRYTFRTHGQAERLLRIGACVSRMLRRGRSVLIVGAQGVGKSIAARRAAGDFSPMRAPHHTCSERGMRAEASLAFGGVLFLDGCEGYSRRAFAVATRPVHGPRTLVGTAAEGSSVASTFDVVVTLVP